MQIYSVLQEAFIQFELLHIFSNNKNQPQSLLLGFYVTDQ